MTPASDIAAALADRVESLVADLLPAGRRNGHCWRAGSVAGDEGASLAVVLRGAKCGRWHDFAADQGGDLLDLIAACRWLSLADAIAWAKDWLGIGPNLSPRPVGTIRRPAPVPDPDKADRIARLLARSVPIRGTLAETYLRSRGVEPDAVASLLDPDALRFVPDAWHWPTQARIPAMVAPVVGITSNRLQALHLTFIRPDGSGKAEVEKARLYFGPKASGCVKLTPDEEVTTGLAVGEGIETTLAAMLAGFPGWATLDAGNLSAFPVLPGIETLTVLADHDPAGAGAAERAATRWDDAGREVRMWSAPAKSRKGYDLNDLLKEGRADG
jgi:hypothetical protein